MTILDKAVFAPDSGGGRFIQAAPRSVREPAIAAQDGDDGTSTRDSAGEPRIAFARWLHDHPGKTPSDFEPLIREAEFAYRCRAAFVSPGDDLGGARATERQLRNLELGLCAGWRALSPIEARSLADWLDAVLPHHPWGAALDWRGSDAQRALADYCGEEQPRAGGTGALRGLTGAGLADTFEQACCFRSWRDVQSLVLAAWLGGAVLVDESGHLIAGWKEMFAGMLASRAGIQG